MIHITKHEPGSKMDGFQSINLHSDCNAKLIKDPKSICSWCHYRRRHRHFPNLDKVMRSNKRIFSKLLKPHQIPWINAGYFRFSSFGDISTITHALNFIAIAAANKQTQFGWWTKKYNLVAMAVVKKNTWPGNLHLNVSAEFLNKPLPTPPPFADRVFTVWEKGRLDEDIVRAEDNNHLCKGQCKDCLVCYNYNNITHVQEYLR